MKKTAKLLPLLLVIVVLLQIPAAADGASPPTLNAKAAVVMDYDTGEILFSKNGDTPRAPASMTKLVTAYIVFEEIEAGRLGFDTVLTVSETASALALNREYTNIPLKTGESVTVDTLMKGMLLPSGCGASLVLAEAISGTEEAFCLRMNDVVAKMGIQAEFTDCYGFAPNLVSARDMAVISRNLIARFPGILDYTSLPSFVFKGKRYDNTNGMLSEAGVDGLKTGTTDAAGYCLTTTAVRDGRRLITVVMGCAKYYRVPDSQKLMNYGFTVASAADPAKTVTLDMETADVLQAGDEGACLLTVLGVTKTYKAELYIELDGETLCRRLVTVKPGEMEVVFPVDAVLGGRDAATLAAVIRDGDRTVASASRTVTVLKADGCINDIEDHWAGDLLERAWEMGMIYPDDEGNFHPDRKVTRAEFVTYIFAMLPDEDVVADCPEHPFADAEGHRAENAIVRAYATGIMQGDGNGQFRPDDTITRQEIATVFLRLMGESFYGAPAPEDMPDFDQVADWAKDAVSALVCTGIINGYEDRTFRPKNDLTRAESVVMALRVIDLLAG